MRPVKSLCLFILALAPLASWAQDKDENLQLQRYDVEVVIFKNIQAPKSREFILPVSSPSREDKMLDLSSPASVKAAAELGYEVLGGDDYRLLEIVTRLIESSRYELLAHVAWRQPGVELEKSMPVWIRGGRIFGNEYTSIDSRIEFFESLPQPGSESDQSGTAYEFDEQTLEALELQLLEQQQQNRHRGLYELEGKITISLSRYLHASADLVLRRPRLSADQVLSPTSQEQYLAAYTAEASILDNHRLRERRRMRSKNLHYLDNPEFSLLILITPYEEPLVPAAVTEDPA